MHVCRRGRCNLRNVVGNSKRRSLASEMVGFDPDEDDAAIYIHQRLLGTSKAVRDRRRNRQ